MLCICEAEKIEEIGPNPKIIGELSDLWIDIWYLAS